MADDVVGSRTRLLPPSAIPSRGEPGGRSPAYVRQHYSSAAMHDALARVMADT